MEHSLDITQCSADKNRDYEIKDNTFLHGLYNSLHGLCTEFQWPIYHRMAMEHEENNELGKPSQAGSDPPAVEGLSGGCHDSCCKDKRIHH